jgi:hypothetical protein
MRTKKLLLGLLSLAANSMMLIETAHADRRSGLAGNLLIEDPDDLFAFPQLTVLHRNMFRLDYGGASDSGNGVLTLGNDREAMSLAVHRGDLLSPDVVGFDTELGWLGGVEGVNPLGATQFGSFAGPAAVDAPATPAVLAATVVDLSYARMLGGNPFGVRLGFGRGVQSEKDANNNVQKGAQTFFAAQVGYSNRPVDRLRWDASGNAVVAFGNSNDTNGNDIDSGYDLRIAGIGRAYYPINRLVDLGFLANLSIDNEKTKNEPTDDSSHDFDFGVRAGVGPSIHLDRAKIAAYGGLRVGAGKNEQSAIDNDDVSRLRLAAPMVNMAAEVQVLDWLYVRTGAEYTWELRRDASDVEQQRVGDGAFRWSAGMGFQKGTFYFDGVVTNGFVTGGPNFIGGTSPGFLAMASLTYKFGDVFGNALDRQATAADANHPLVVERPAEHVAERPPPARNANPGPAPVATPTVEPSRPLEPDQELSPPVVDTKGTTTTTRSSNQVGGTAKGTLKVGN